MIGLGAMNTIGPSDNLRQSLGELGSYINSTKTRQMNSFNSIIGAKVLSAGIINTGKIEQKGALNLQPGIGRKFGVINFGQIESAGTSFVEGYGLAFGIFNAGCVKLSGQNSCIIGGEILNGIRNLGQLQTSDNSDIVAGISGRVGIINSYDQNLAVYQDLLPKIASAVQAASAASEINTKEGDDLIYGGDLYNAKDFLSKLPNVPQFASQFLTDILSTNPNSKDASIGNLNFGRINTGLGNDVVFGAGDDITAPGNTTFLAAAGISSIGSGVMNAAMGIINLGEGDDLLAGEAWALNLPKNGESSPAGIINYGKIKTGDGNDHICGFSGTTTSSNKGIFNDGTIMTGSGNDFVDALTGGFSGTGLTNPGLGGGALVSVALTEDWEQTHFSLGVVHIHQWCQSRRFRLLTKVSSRRHGDNAC